MAAEHEARALKRRVEDLEVRLLFLNRSAMKGGS